MLRDTNLFLLQGRLTGLGGEDLPTVVIVAHYDSFGVAPVSILSVPVFFPMWPLLLCFSLASKTWGSYKWTMAVCYLKGCEN